MAYSYHLFTDQAIYFDIEHDDSSSMLSNVNEQDIFAFMLLLLISNSKPVA
jgi:hypothetical protein